MRPPGRAGVARLRPDGWAAALLTGAAVVLLGAPVGLLWGAVAPRADLVPAGSGLTLRNDETKDFIAADGLLFLLGITAGVLAAVLVWRLANGRSLYALAGLVCGGGLAAYVASRTGVLLHPPQAVRAVLASGDPHSAQLALRVHARAVLLGWPAGSAAVFLVLTVRQATPGVEPGAGDADTVLAAPVPTTPSAPDEQERRWPR